MNDNILNELYSQIHLCKKCAKVDKFKVCRKIDKTNPSSDVVVILQALAEHTMRKSGINFYYENEELSSTGKNLEKFLTKINRTIIPNKPNTVYSTDIVQCFPGKQIGKSVDRKPTADEIQNCIEYLKKEIEIINPKLIILIGEVSRKSFYKYFMKKEPGDFSSNVGVLEDYMGIHIISIFHPSGLSRGYNPMLKNEEIFKNINSLIN